MTTINSDASTTVPPYKNKPRTNGPWSKEEDKALIDIARSIPDLYQSPYRQGDPNKFDTIRIQLASQGIIRYTEEIRKIWKERLNPNVMHGGIAPYDKDIIEDLHRQYGNQWELISLIHCRDHNDQNHYYTASTIRQYFNRKCKDIDSITHSKIQPGLSSEEPRDIIDISLGKRKIQNISPWEEEEIQVLVNIAECVPDFYQNPCNQGSSKGLDTVRTQLASRGIIKSGEEIHKIWKERVNPNVMNERIADKDYSAIESLYLLYGEQWGTISKTFCRDYGENKRYYPPSTIKHHFYNQSRGRGFTKNKEDISPFSSEESSSELPNPKRQRQCSSQDISLPHKQPWIISDQSESQPRTDQTLYSQHATIASGDMSNTLLESNVDIHPPSEILMELQQRISQGNPEGDVLQAYAHQPYYPNLSQFTEIIKTYFPDIFAINLSKITQESQKLKTAINTQGDSIRSLRDAIGKRKYKHPNPIRNGDTRNDKKDLDVADPSRDFEAITTSEESEKFLPVTSKARKDDENEEDLFLFDFSDDVDWQ